jgi:hypothetical protein
VLRFTTPRDTEQQLINSLAHLLDDSPRDPRARQILWPQSLGVEEVDGHPQVKLILILDVHKPVAAFEPRRVKVRCMDETRRGKVGPVLFAFSDALRHSRVDRVSTIGSIPVIETPPARASIWNIVVVVFAPKGKEGKCGPEFPLFENGRSVGDEGVDLQLVSQSREVGEPENIWPVRWDDGCVGRRWWRWWRGSAPRRRCCRRVRVTLIVVRVAVSKYSAIK